MKNRQRIINRNKPRIIVYTHTAHECVYTLRSVLTSVSDGARSCGTNLPCHVFCCV